MSRALPLVIVAGAAGGMGSAIVRDLAADHHVIAIGRRLAALDDAFAGVENVECRELDLIDYARFGEVLGDVDELDGFVHAAAVAPEFSLESATVGDWRHVYEINVVSPAEMIRVLLPALRAAEGQVVLLNSGAGTRGIAGSAVYSASKHALYGLADSLRLEEERHRVRVSTVAPGPTATKMLDASSMGARGVERERVIAPESVAKAVRLVLDTTPDAQITQVSVRPRAELG